MARAAYANGHNPIGHRYSMAATLYRNEPMCIDRFDELQAGYRAWLCFNRFPQVDTSGNDDSDAESKRRGGAW